MRRMKAISIVIAITLGTGGSVSLWLALRGICDQHYKINDYKPVTATVVSSSLEKVAVALGLKPAGYTYKPRIAYSYSVGGTEYRSNGVSVYEERTGTKWAKEVISQFQEGHAVTAYYNPKNPSEAFLLREYVFKDQFGGVLIATFLLACSIGWSLLIYHEFRHPRPPLQGLSDWLEVAPYSRLKPKLIVAGTIAIVWHATAFVTCGYYFSVLPASYIRPTLSTALYELIGLVPLVLAVYYLLLARRVDEARVLVTTDTFAIGHDFTVKVEQSVRWRKGITEATIALVCKEVNFVRESGFRQYTKKQTPYEASTSLLTNSGLSLPEQLETDWSIQIPPDQAPSTTFGAKILPNSPRYSWYFEVNTKFRRPPHYKAKFPITVRGPTPSQKRPAPDSPGEDLA